MKNIFAQIALCASIFSIFAAPALGQTDAPPELVKRGEYLSLAAGCANCHTSKGGKPYAGGLSIETPFGQVYAPNITPDKKTGIGNWTDEDFYRSMHEGIGKNGEYLYPVFPYTSYTKMTREDVLAIKAYLFSLEPVEAAAKPNELEFPYNIRQALGFWRALFFEVEKPESKAGEADEASRGGYLVNAVAHCGECHTPRNLLGAKIEEEALQGATIEGYYAPNITNTSAGIGDWSKENLVNYFNSGAAKGEGVAIGPMAQVIHESLSKLTEGDKNAIAAYLKDQPSATKQQVKESAVTPEPVSIPGADAYLNYCASCHQIDGKGIEGAVPPLQGNGSVLAKGPQNVIKAVLGGLPATAQYGPMPSFANALSNQQITDVVNYVRTKWGTNETEDRATTALVSELRANTPIMYLSDSRGGEIACKSGREKAIRKAELQPGDDVLTLMRDVNDVNILQQVQAIVGKVKPAAQDIDNAAIINGLTDSYCRIVAEIDGLSVYQKKWRLDRFSQLVYTELQTPSGTN